MNFEDLIAKVKTCGKQKLAVAAAEDDAVLEAVDAAHKQGIADAMMTDSSPKTHNRGKLPVMNFATHWKKSQKLQAMHLPLVCW